MKVTLELSKRVGWEPRNVTWPTLEQVDDGTDEQILIWSRFLPTALTEEHQVIQRAIYWEFSQ